MFYSDAYANKSTFFSHTIVQLKIHKSNVPEDKTMLIVKHVNEAMDKFTIEKVSVFFYFYVVLLLIVKYIFLFL
jgi:hypothetical protein